jgi:DnaJ-class molecular chaperone
MKETDKIKPQEECLKCGGLGKYDYYDESDNWICNSCNGTGKLNKGEK